MEVLTYDLEGSVEDMIHRLGWQERLDYRALEIVVEVSTSVFLLRDYCTPRCETIPDRPPLTLPSQRNRL
jgi:hypothetical protein